MSKKLTVSAAEAAFERAKAELKEARARETEEERKRDLHRKIVAGAFLIKLLPEQPKLLQAFYDYLAPKDRRDFAPEFATLKPPSKDAAKEPGGDAAAPKSIGKAAPPTTPTVSKAVAS